MLLQSDFYFYSNSSRPQALLTVSEQHNVTENAVNQSQSRSEPLHSSDGKTWKNYPIEKPLDIDHQQTILRLVFSLVIGAPIRGLQNGWKPLWMKHQPHSQDKRHDKRRCKETAVPFGCPQVSHG